MTHTTVKAIHRIRFSDAVLKEMGRNPKTDITPGEVFSCPDDQLAWLVKNGAVASAKARTSAEAKVLAALEPEAEPETESGTVTPSGDGLAGMSDEDLAAKAKKLGVKVTKAMKRDTIIAKIELAESALEDETGEDETDNLV